MQVDMEVSIMAIGYDPDFIGDGIRIPLPHPNKFKAALKKSTLKEPGILREDFFSDHIHFTLVMNKNTRQLVYSAANIDQDQFIAKVPGNGEKSWSKVKAIGE